MPWLSLRSNVPIVQKKFERLRRKIPLISRKRIYDAMVEIRHQMKVPGQKPSYPIQWDSDRQRKAFFASDGFGHGIPTQRSGAYTKAWMVSRVGDQGYDVGNPLAHAKFIGGTARSGRTQSRIHRGRWPLFYLVINSVLVKFPKKVKDSIVTIARHEGFRAE